MDAASIVVALATAGVTLTAEPADENSAPTRLWEGPSVSVELLPAGPGEAPRQTFAQRHTTRQPISGGQLESGFSQATQQVNAAGQNLNNFGATLQQNAGAAQRAFATKQQQFAEAQFIPPSSAAASQRTIGGELREGAGRLVDRAKSALGKTGEAIGGTARKLRDRLPGRRYDAAPTQPLPGAPGSYAPYNYDAAPSPGDAFVAGGAAPLATPPQPSLDGGAGSAAPPLPSRGVPNFVDNTRAGSAPFGGERSTLTGNQDRRELVPVSPPIVSGTPAGGDRRFGQQEPGPAPSGADWPYRQADDYRHTPPTPTADPRFNAGAPADYRGGSLYADQGATGVDDRGFATRPTGGSTPAVMSVLDTAPDPRATQPFPATGSPPQPAFGQPMASDPPGASSGPLLTRPTEPFYSPQYDQTVAKPTDQFGPPLPGASPGGAPYGPGNGYQAPAPPLAAPNDPNYARYTAATSPQGLPPGNLTDPDSKEPWRELVFATVVALGSVGGNLFLGWSYLDARNKYRSALRRTSRAFGHSGALSDD